MLDVSVFIFFTISMINLISGSLDLLAYDLKTKKEWARRDNAIKLAKDLKACKTWKDISDNYESEPPECSFCLADFEDSDKVV